MARTGSGRRVKTCHKLKSAQSWRSRSRCSAVNEERGWEIAALRKHVSEWKSRRTLSLKKLDSMFDTVALSPVFSFDVSAQLPSREENQATTSSILTRPGVLHIG